MTTETKPPPRSPADSATKRISKARKMVKDAMKAMTTIRARIVTLRHEADELEQELNAMVEGFGLAIPPASAEDVARWADPPTLNGRRIDAVEAPVVVATPAADIRDMISPPNLDDLRETPMVELVGLLAQRDGKALNRVLGDCGYAGVRTAGQLVAWLQAEPGRPLIDLLSRGGDVDAMVEAMRDWSRLHDFTADELIEPFGLPSEWFDEAADEEETDPEILAAMASAPKPKYPVTYVAGGPVDPGRSPPKSKRPKLEALPSELQLKLRDALDPDRKEWANYRRLKIDDMTLLAVLKVRFADLPTEKRGRRWSCKGGDDPRFWPTASGYKGGERNALRGAALIDAVRDVMGLTKP